MDTAQGSGVTTRSSPVQVAGLATELSQIRAIGKLGHDVSLPQSRGPRS